MKPLFIRIAIAASSLYLSGCGTTQPSRTALASPAVAQAAPQPVRLWDLDASKPISARQLDGMLQSVGLNKPGG